MFRRCRIHRFLGQSNDFKKNTDKESTRMNNERRRRIIYDSSGNLQLGGLLYMLYEDFHKPFLILCAGVFFFYGYQQVVISLTKGEDVRTAEIDRMSEEQARESGKLKSDRYLVKPQRQIDDPDFLNIPAFSGKGAHKSKLFDDDDPSSNPLFSGRNRSS